MDFVLHVESLAVVVLREASVQSDTSKAGNEMLGSGVELRVG